MTDLEREAFERYILGFHKYPSVERQPEYPSLYADRDTRAAWFAWQARAQAQQWRPIETAPHGVELFLYRQDAGAFTGIYTHVAAFASERECEDLDEDTLFHDDWFGGDYRGNWRLDGSESPTHWMPLPAGPEVNHD